MATTPPSLTLTSLLNSLHTHLQSQTQLLPTLHAQLGLPPTALEDELQTLKEKLMHSVESQIDIRRKEVDLWMKKCDDVEVECIRYAKALGGNVKATGNSVGELRKELVLPRRFELVSEFQEKLRQLYHTKLEQLTTLTNRLSALSRTLGSDFYAAEILTMSPVVDDPDSANSDTANRDVTPERFSKLEKELVRGKAEVSKRLTQLSATFVQIDWLYTELGITPPSIQDLPSSSSFTNSGSTSNVLSASSADPFIASTPTPTSRSGSGSLSITPLLFLDKSTPIPTSAGDDHEIGYQRIFARFVARVEEVDDEDLPSKSKSNSTSTSKSTTIPIGLESVEPTPPLLAWSSALRTHLEETKKRRESHIQAMYDQLEGLWKRLGVEECEMDAFVEAHRGSTEETVREYEEELERMLELKRERMSVFVGSARVEIERLWDELMVGEAEREDFTPFVDDEHTEELLTVHEEEIKRLKDEKRAKAPLLASIKKYFDICEEEKELAAAASDQTRLLGRGRDPGRLLREEKMRKRVSKEKPRLEQDLLASIPAWEREADRPFLVHGESILQILMETVSAADQENASKRNGKSRAGSAGASSRGGSVPPRSTTPVNPIHHYVPGSAGYGKAVGVVTPAVRQRPGSSMGAGADHSQPTKRQRVGEQPPPQPQRAPLGSHRAGNRDASRAGSPSKNHSSSLPRPVHMPVPKPGTQHYALGHGRMPTGGFTFGAAGTYAQQQLQMRTSSTSTSGSGTYATTRYASGAGAGATYSFGPTIAVVAKKASRARRESFKPRSSVDGHSGDLGVSVGMGASRFTGFAGGVREEEEGY